MVKSYRKRSSKRSRKPVYKKATVYPSRKVEVKRNMRAVTAVLTSNPMLSTTNAPYMNIDGGSGADDRIGNQISARGHLLSGIMRNETAKTMIVRMVKLYNRRADNSVIDQDTDLFLSLGLPVTAANLGFRALFAPFNREQFKIVSDKRFKLGTSDNNAEDIRIIKEYTKLSHTTKYTNSNGSNINYGNLQVFFIAYPADNAAGINDTVSLDFESTAYYVE